MTRERGLEMFTVYENPRDFPGQYVARRFVIEASGPKPDPEPLIVSNLLGAIRAEMYRRGLVCLTRADNDDPCIVEVWL